MALDVVPDICALSNPNGSLDAACHYIPTALAAAAAWVNEGPQDNVLRIGLLRDGEVAMRVPKPTRTVYRGEEQMY